MLKMTMISSFICQVKTLLLFLSDILFRCKKLVEYMITGKHEFERICESQCDIYEKTMRIDKWLARTNCRTIKKFRSHKIDLRLDQLFNSKDLISRLSTRDEQELEASKNNSHKYSVRPEHEIDKELHNQLDSITSEYIRVIEKTKHCKLAKRHKETLHNVLFTILGYELTLKVAQRLANLKYEAEQVEHLKRLISLWNNLVESDKLRSNGEEDLSCFPPNHRTQMLVNQSAIVSNRWSTIGFQGEDPGTDFRGMGLLGLFQLEYLSRASNYVALDLLRHSLDESYGYPFAITGINITFSLLNLFKDGSVKNLYFDPDSQVRQREKHSKHALKLITTFNDLYVDLFVRFDHFWRESKPENIFAFGGVMDRFVSITRQMLCNREFRFTRHPVVEARDWSTN